jgi:hypothetical protein
MRTNTFSIVLLRHIAIPAQDLQIIGEPQANYGSIPTALVRVLLPVFLSVAGDMVNGEEPRQGLTATRALSAVAGNDCQLGFPQLPADVVSDFLPVLFSPFRVIRRALCADPSLLNLSDTASRTDTASNFTDAPNFSLASTSSASLILPLSKARAANVAKTKFYAVFTPFVLVFSGHLRHDGDHCTRNTNVRDALQRLEVELLAA